MQNQPVALIVNNDQRQIEQLRSVLSDESLDVLVSHNFYSALERVERVPIDTLITPLKTDLLDGLKVLEIARMANPDVDAVFITGHLSRGYLAQESSRQALLTHEHSHLLVTPINPTYLRNLLRKILETRRLLIENRQLRLRIDGHFAKEDLIGNSAAIQSVRRLVAQIATSRASVLILGDRGTGRQLTARAIHHRSLRKGHFVVFNCDLVDDAFTSTELFPTDPTMDFTGLTQVGSRESRYNSAHGGTLFLREIGKLSLLNQVKLLQHLVNQDLNQQESASYGNPPNPDVRLICSSHQDLTNSVVEGELIPDLYDRLNVIQIQMCSLSERQEDIPLLANSFLEEFCFAYKKPIKLLTQPAVDALKTYHWPGNIRELRSTVEGMVAVSNDQTLDLDAIPQSILEQVKIEPTDKTGGEPINAVVGMTMAAIESEAIRSTLRAVGKNRVEAAKMLGISRRTIFRKIREYNL